jgi:asparagine synthase (glutamine-hydrolysing)
MCAIAGLSMAANASPPDAEALAAMLRAMAPRGPDGSGTLQFGQTALGHLRLSIIDLAGGAQPLTAAETTLVANAEIYNYREIRAALPDATFTTQSDCESALHAFRAHGAQFTAKLRGMYALALYSTATSTLTLARDPFGIKPLYYARIAGGLAFASQPAAFLAAGLVRRELRPQARAELLQMQFTVGRATIFPEINRVLPGEMIRIANGAITARDTAPVLSPAAPETITEAEALHRLDRALMDSIELHLRSDVPVGLFLSGGIDSATLLTALVRAGAKPNAYTAHFATPGAADEREAAAAHAKSAGIEHVPVEVTEADALRHLPAIAACMDDPAADYAIIPTWFLARRARQDVKVVLSGEGGDELFAGYGRYRTAARPWWLGGRRMRERGTFDGLDVLWNDLPDWRNNWTATELAANPHWSLLQAAQAADIAEWLPNDLLAKLDRCLMAHGVEGRTPLLDRGVAAAAFRLPDSLKIKGSTGKHLLRAWLAKNLPAARAAAPKQGFTVPIGTWIANHGDRLAPLMAALPSIQEIADPDRVSKLFRAPKPGRQSTAAWTLLFYALWHRAHIEALPTDGDVFEVLSA